MKIKFITFRPEWDYDHIHHCSTCRSTTLQVNDWLAENPNVEIISWQACPVGDHNELYITIQYREFEED